VVSGCQDRRADLAARALGHLEPEADAALDAHLDGCAACRAELAELRAIADAVALADPAELDPAPVDPHLGERVVARVAREAAAVRRRRRRRVAAAVTAAAAVVVAVAVAVGLVVDGPGSGGEAPVVELAGPGEAVGSARLVARAWGTEVVLEVSGLDDGDVYWVWLTDDDGERVGAGTLVGTGERAEAVLASAVPADAARRIWVTDEADRVVLDACLRGTCS
jgi:anti-sigma factor RsiW